MAASNSVTPALEAAVNAEVNSQGLAADRVLARLVSTRNGSAPSSRAAIADEQAKRSAAVDQEGHSRGESDLIQGIDCTTEGFGKACQRARASRQGPGQGLLSALRRVRQNRRPDGSRGCSCGDRGFPARHRQGAHSPQAFPGQTTKRSPLSRSEAQISWPRIRGSTKSRCPCCHILASVRQTAQWDTFRRTSSGLDSGGGRSQGTQMADGLEEQGFH